MHEESGISNSVTFFTVAELREARGKTKHPGRKQVLEELLLSTRDPEDMVTVFTEHQQNSVLEALKENRP
jgi:hypothetical protein